MGEGEVFRQHRVEVGGSSRGWSRLRRRASKRKRREALGKYLELLGMATNPL